MVNELMLDSRQDTMGSARLNRGKRQGEHSHLPEFRKAHSAPAF